MAYEWFKLYAEARVDRKLARLTLAERGVWINLLCYASEQDDRGAFDASDMFLLAIECAEGDEALLRATLEKLEQAHCIERHDARDGWLRFRTFNKRQESTHTKPSDSPERVAERVHKHRERQRSTALQNDVTPSNAFVTRVTPSNAIEGEGEGDAEPEGDIQPPPSVVDEDIRHRHLRARARTRGDEPDVLEEAETATPATAKRRMSLDAFTQSFANAAGLSPGERGKALEAIITAYRPAADDALLIVEATNCAAYYAGRKPSRTVDCRLLANWMARWRTSQAAQEAQTAERRAQAPPTAPAASSRRSGANGRRAPDLPDPTRNGRYAHLFTVVSNDDGDDDGADESEGGDDAQ